MRSGYATGRRQVAESARLALFWRTRRDARWRELREARRASETRVLFLVLSASFRSGESHSCAQCQTEEFGSAAASGERREERREKREREKERKGEKERGEERFALKQQVGGAAELASHCCRGCACALLVSQRQTSWKWRRPNVGQKQARLSQGSPNAPFAQRPKTGWPAELTRKLRRRRRGTRRQLSMLASRLQLLSSERASERTNDYDNKEEEEWHT